MAYTREDVEKIASEKVVDPRPKNKRGSSSPYKWWLAQNDKDLTAWILSTTEYLKKTNMTRIRQASIFTRIHSGKPLYNYLASNATLDNSNQLPIGRPTANIVYTSTDTLWSRITQDKPKPVLLTSGGNYRDQKTAKEANKFVQGEFFRTKAYDLGSLAFRDTCVLGDGLIKVYAKDKKIKADRTLETELLTDFNDAYYGNPRQLIQLKLCDRGEIIGDYPDAEEIIESAVHGNVDSTPRSTETISDQLITAEAWHLPSSPDADDGRHSIVCSEGVVHDEKWERDHYPFAKLGYNPNIVGWNSQGLTEILMPTQMEIYRQLIIGSQNFEIMGVPRILIEEMSKILETAFNNRIGSIIKYRNTPPEFVNAEANCAGWLPYVQWLIQNGYQSAGISMQAAGGVKPAGLNSGEAQREFMVIQDERFAALQSRYQGLYTDLAALYLETAEEIVEEHGKYETVFPGRDGTRVIDYKQIKRLKDNFVIQIYEESSLPSDPAGRQARISEMLAAGEIDLIEFRKLSQMPDLEESDQLALALYERILHSLDEIVENGAKNYASIAPDQFILDPTDLATKLCVNYINRYSVMDLEEEKMQLLRDWFTQVQTQKQQANPPPMLPPGAGAPPGAGQGAPGPNPLQVAPPAQSLAPTSNAQV